MFCCVVKNIYLCTMTNIKYKINCEYTTVNWRNNCL